MLVGMSVPIFVAIFATFTEAGLGTFSLPALYEYSQTVGFDSDFQKIVFPLFVIGAGSLAVSGRSTRGRPTVTLPRRPLYRCSTPAC